MKKYSILSIALLLYLVSCQGGAPTGALDATIEAQRLSNSMADSYADVVRRSTGWDDDTTKRVLETIGKAQDDVDDLLEKVKQYLRASGRVDWERIYTAAERRFLEEGGN